MAHFALSCIGRSFFIHCLTRRPSASISDLAFFNTSLQAPGRTGAHPAADRMRLGCLGLALILAWETGTLLEQEGPALVVCLNQDPG